MEKEYYDNCERCGRRFPKKIEPECNWSCGPTSECCGCAVGRIKKDADPCKSCCIIPSITVEATDGITNLANCLVHVTSINTTFYIDDKHRPMIIWAGPVEVDLPADVHESFNLKSQFLYVKFENQDDHKKIIDSFYFDKTGKLYRAGEFEEVTEA